MKDCAVQFAVNGKMVEDTDLINRCNADKIWEKCVPVFKQAVADGVDAELALWVDMQYQTNYRKKDKYWRSSDMVIERGVMYEKHRVA